MNYSCKMSACSCVWPVINAWQKTCPPIAALYTGASMSCTYTDAIKNKNYSYRLV